MSQSARASLQGVFRGSSPGSARHIFVLHTGRWFMETRRIRKKRLAIFKTNPAPPFYYKKFGMNARSKNSSVYWILFLRNLPIASMPELRKHLT